MDTINENPNATWNSINEDLHKIIKEDQIVKPKKGTNCFLIKTYFEQSEVCESDFHGAYVELGNYLIGIVKELNEIVKKNESVYEILSGDGSCSCTFIPDSFMMHEILADNGNVEVEGIEDPEEAFDGDDIIVYEQYLCVDDKYFYWKMKQKFNGLTYETVRLSIKEYCD